MKIVVDAMGGDHAPEAIVEGAVMAVREYGIEVILIGISGRVESELSKFKDHANLPIQVVHAEDVVEMHESPSKVLRSKKSHQLTLALSWLKMAMRLLLLALEYRRCSCFCYIFPASSKRS